MIIFLIDKPMQKKAGSWETLAKRNNLTFIPGRLLQDRDRVVGSYRGYHLQLSYWSFGIEISLTVMGEFTPLKHELDPSQDIDNMLFNSHLASLTWGYIRAQDGGRKFFYHHVAGIGNNINEVQRLQYLIDLLVDLANVYHKFLVLGSEVIPIFKAIVQHRKLPSLGRQLLHDIEEDTAQRLGQRIKSLSCSECIARPAMHKVNIIGASDSHTMTYYGCRICHQSRNFIESREVIIVLDNRMGVEQSFDFGVLRVNWLIRRNLFDFDKVEILQVTDEDVEKFAVQVGNNTEPVQKAQYRRIICLVSSHCHLSENTLRILRRLFGRVEVKQFSQ